MSLDSLGTDNQVHPVNTIYGRPPLRGITRVFLRRNLLSACTSATRDPVLPRSTLGWNHPRTTQEPNHPGLRLGVGIAPKVVGRILAIDDSSSPVATLRAAIAFVCRKATELEKGEETEDDQSHR